MRFEQIPASEIHPVSRFGYDPLPGNRGEEERDMSNPGRDHDERRKAQAAAARKHRLKNKFNKATRKAWKKGEDT